MQRLILVPVRTFMCRKISTLQNMVIECGVGCGASIQNFLVDRLSICGEASAWGESAASAPGYASECFYDNRMLHIASYRLLEKCGVTNLMQWTFIYPKLQLDLTEICIDLPASVPCLLSAIDFCKQGNDILLLENSILHPRFMHSKLCAVCTYLPASCVTHEMWRQMPHSCPQKTSA